MSELRRRRKVLGLSISKLSQEAKVNAAVLSWVELGKVSASAKFRLAIAEFYKEPEAAFFNDVGFAI